MTRWSSFSLLAAILIAALSVQPGKAGNTTCVSKQLDWYSSVVGESPCVTYQRLRQICNNDYQVPNFDSQVPGDRCDDQVSACCCNTIAFQLSMLCMVCQQDTQDTGGIGIDAPKPGTFDVYGDSCHPVVNHTLPNDIQSAVCNENIRIDNFLYGGWDDGTWFYVWTKENAERDHAANNNNTFTHCPNQISISVSSSPASILNAGATEATTKPTSSSWISASSPNAPIQTTGAGLGSDEQSKLKLHGALIGGVVGGILCLILIVLATIVWTRRKTSNERLKRARNDRFGYMHHEIPPSASAVAKSSLAPSGLGTGLGALSSQFSYSDCLMSGTSTTAPGTSWSNACNTSPNELSPRHDDSDSLYALSRSNSGLLSAGYDDAPRTGDSDRATKTKHTRSQSGAAASVSLSAFDFTGSQVHDDGQTMRSFPLSVTNEFVTFHRGP